MQVKFSNILGHIEKKNYISKLLRKVVKSRTLTRKGKIVSYTEKLTYFQISIQKIKAKKPKKDNTIQHVLIVSFIPNNPLFICGTLFQNLPQGV